MRPYRLSSAAQADIDFILDWTDLNFGEQARIRYEELLTQAIVDLRYGRGDSASVNRPELGGGVRLYHLTHSRNRVQAAGGRVKQPRHVLLYRHGPDGVIEVGRVLHDAADVDRHVPEQWQE